jgi:UDP-N-acetyl-D-mannosaminuronate dehydrogenase
MMMSNKVPIIGLGQLGLPAVSYVKERGFDTYGYDNNSNTMEIAERTVGIEKETDFGSFITTTRVWIGCTNP